MVLHQLPLPQVEEGVGPPGAQREPPAVLDAEEDHLALLHVERVEGHVEVALELHVVMARVEEGVLRPRKDELLVRVAVVGVAGALQRPLAALLRTGAQRR